MSKPAADRIPNIPQSRPSTRDIARGWLLVFAVAGLGLGLSCSSDGSACANNADCPDGVCVDAVTSASTKVCKSWCTSYCDTAEYKCTGANQLWTDHASCMSFCEALPAGNEGDLDGDTAQCRRSHAEAAEMDPAAHCPHASASGGGVCGAWCDVYCRLMQDSCPQIYADAASCQSTCAGFAATGAAGDLDGNTVQCRITHALAAEGDNSHCLHASPPGTGACQ